MVIRLNANQIETARVSRVVKSCESIKEVKEVNITYLIGQVLFHLKIEIYQIYCDIDSQETIYTKFKFSLTSLFLKMKKIELRNEL